MFLSIGDTAKAVDNLKKSSFLYGQLNVDSARAYALLALSQATGGLEPLRQAQQIFECRANEQGRTRVFLGLSLYHHGQGNFRASIPMTKHALHFASSGPHPGLEGQALCELALAYYKTGKIPGASELISRSESLRQIGGAGHYWM